MAEQRELVLGIVAGEQSGENLALDLVDAIAARTGTQPKLVGVGADRLSERGLESVFDPSEISVTGISAVLATLPRILVRIRQTASALIAAQPDAIVLVDSPDFSHRVAKRVKRALPDTPIIKYVAPTVWAWRPGRARKMAAYIDHVLAVLPFEPAIMKQLGGPETHYVGHSLAADRDISAIWAERQEIPAAAGDGSFDLLVLPGSRNGELSALLPDFGAAVAILHERGNRFRVHMPTLPRLADRLRRETSDWPVRPDITVTRQEKLAAFRAADAALAASGTVLLELALAGIPMLSCYRVDPIMRVAASMITAWTAALPNVIADRAIVPEYFNDSIRPGLLARRVEELASKSSPAAGIQVDGFREVRARMTTDENPGTKAAQIILDILQQP